MAFAVKRGLRDDNPAHGVKKPPVRKMERFLSEPEIARLAVAMDDEAGKSGTPYPAAGGKSGTPYPAAAITGARLRLAVPIAAN